MSRKRECRTTSRSEFDGSAVQDQWHLTVPEIDLLQQAVINKPKKKLGTNLAPGL